MSDAEPRRSVRSTKGQHKSLDQLDQSNDGTKKRGRKSGGKKLDEHQEDDTEEEIIRCVCGATEQDADPGEPWIACDRCTAWQHNVCMGMSVYSEDLVKDYYCEQCKPENHKELLEGMARGEKPWEERRRLYEEEKATDKRRKGGRKGKGKRNSDAKEGSAKPSPTPEARRETKGPGGTKRKTRADSEDQDVKYQKRKLSESQALPVYNAPTDLPKLIADLPDARQNPARGLCRAISEVLGGMHKRGEFSPTDGATVEAAAEQFAIQIERAVHDVHPSHKEYGTQIRTLRFNLKENHELCARLLHGTLIPPMLATMTSDELASKELQQKTAKMKAQAERQSILDTEDAAAPRLRRTHKGEELVERDNANVASEEKPSALRRQSLRDGGGEGSGLVASDGDRPGSSVGISHRQVHGRGSLRVETKSELSSKKDFDLKRVFSSVRSPTSASHQRRPSQPQFLPDGPGIDPEVDRLLEDDQDDSPPYSPSDETDPDIVWRGHVAMNPIANFAATARHVGGVNLSATIGLPWTTLVPKKLTVAGRIDEQIATEYLCSLRYSAPTDITVASLSPATESAKADFLSLIDYFTLRNRYGVVGEKGVGNVRDTYLVPVLAGAGSHPEFMLNLEDNFIPVRRAAPMLLLVVVYRNDADAMERLRGPNWAEQCPMVPAVAELPEGMSSSSASVVAGAARTTSISAPAFSPTVPQVPVPQASTAQQLPHSSPSPMLSQQQTLPMQLHPLAPRHVGQVAGEVAGQITDQNATAFLPSLNATAHIVLAPATQAAATPAATVTPAASVNPVVAVSVPQASRDTAQREGEAIAREILGPFASCPAAGFLMTQAAKMQRNEWMIVRSVFQQQPQTQEDLQLLRHELEQYNSQQGNANNGKASNGGPRVPHPPAVAMKPSQTPVPIPKVPHTAATPAISPRPVQSPSTTSGAQSATTPM